MPLETYPLNNMDYSAEDAELFHCTRSSGIYANNDFDYSVSGADNTITIGTGLGWIRNSKFSGKVVALKEPTSLNLGVPDSIYPRIDAVAIQFDANKNSTEIVVKNGAPASSPEAPAVSRTEALYELHLYHIRREAGAVAISVSNVTDIRLDPNYCGLMADSVTQVDTSAISAQVKALIKELREEIQSVKDGSAYLARSGGTMTGALKVLLPTESAHAASKGYVDGKWKTTTLTLVASAWSDGMQTVSLKGVTADESKTDVIAAPVPDDDNFEGYAESNVRLYAQLDGAVTFKCSIVPDRDLNVNVALRV